MTQRTGEVFDLGYQHYDGPREGRSRARLALWTNGVRTVLGLGRGARAKILPTLLFVGAIGPAIILTLVAASGGADQVPGHSGYYQIISIILLLFAAIMAPELLCPDRRDRVIDLYLVRPLTPADYVAARWLAFFSITLALVYSGQVTLLAGFVLAAADPFDYLRENWLDIPRFLAAGAILAAFITSLPLAVSAFTTRRAYAAAFVIGLFMISTITVQSLAQCDEHEPTLPDGTCQRQLGKATKWLALGDIVQVPNHVNRMVFEDTPRNRLTESVSITVARDLPNSMLVGWYVLMTGGPALLLGWRYGGLRR